MRLKRRGLYDCTRHTGDCRQLLPRISPSGGPEVTRGSSTGETLCTTNQLPHLLRQNHSETIMCLRIPSHKGPMPQVGGSNGSHRTASDRGVSTIACRFRVHGRLATTGGEMRRAAPWAALQKRSLSPSPPPPLWRSSDPVRDFHCDRARRRQDRAESPICYPRRQIRFEPETLSNRPNHFARPCPVSPESPYAKSSRGPRASARVVFGAERGPTGLWRPQILTGVEAERVGQRRRVARSSMNPASWRSSMSKPASTRSRSISPWA